MSLSLSAVTLVVPDYDEAIAFFVGVLGFHLLEDTPLTSEKRWVRVAPSRDGSAILLAKAATDAQRAAIGNQTGGRVSLFLETQSFDADYEKFKAGGVNFTEIPRREAYGSVVVFEDPFGNLWDLIQSN